jgi:hypothetical protein
MAGAFKVGSRPEMKRKNIVVVLASYADVICRPLCSKDFSSEMPAHPKALPNSG